MDFVIDKHFWYYNSCIISFIGRRYYIKKFRITPTYKFCGNCKYVHYCQDSSQFIILKNKESAAFGSGHYILGLYSMENKIIDECLFGEFPLQFINWEKDKLEFRVICFNDNYKYVKMWLERNQSISNYNLEFEIEEKR